MVEAMNEQKRQCLSMDTAVTALFFALGTTNFITLFLAMSSVQDDLVETSLPTSVAILSLLTPFFLWTLVAPFIIPNSPYVARILFASVVQIVGVLLVSVLELVAFKLIGLCFISLGAGILETSFISLTAFYEDITVKAYAGGTGLGFALGPLYYTGMTSLGCASPKTTLLTSITLPLLVVLLCVILDKIGNSDSSTDDYHCVQYSTLDSTGQENQPITSQIRLQTILNSTPKMLTLLMGVSSELMMPQAVVTTVVFPDAPFSPREHFLYYFSTFAVGVLLGRSYGLLVSLVAPNAHILVEKTWIFTTFLIVNVSLGIINSWYHFIPSVWIVLVLLFAHGVMAGALYMNTFATAGKSENSARLREISRAFTTLGSGGGMILAGLLGLWVESKLKEHCFQRTRSMELCLTRSVFNVTAQCTESL